MSKLLRWYLRQGLTLADGRGDTVQLTTGTCRRDGLGSQEAEVVARADLTESKEDTVHDGEAGDMLDEMVVGAGQGKAEDGLHCEAKDERVLGAKVVDNQRADNLECEHSLGGFPVCNSRFPGRRTH